MNRCFLIISIGVGLICLPLPVRGQSVTAKKVVPPFDAANKYKPDAKAESERLAKERREKALSLLVSLASDASSFQDLTLRARSLARIGDALWDTDAEQGNALFRKAWEAAETADREARQPLNVRRQVLKLIAKRNRLLADECLQKEKADQDANKSEPLGTSSWGLPAASEQRLRLAADLLAAGDIERALQFADPVLSSITISTVEFLTQLREKNPAAADSRYAAMLSSASANILTDANSVSILFSYIFTPHTYVIFNNEGGASSSVPRSFSPPVTIDAQLRLSFFQSAAGILLRPQTTPEQDESSAGIAGKFMVIKRLMPLFEQYAPKEITEAMRGQLEALNSVVRDGLRDSNDEWEQKGITPEKKQRADQEQSLLDQIEHVKTSDERDDLYFKLALLAVTDNNIRARDYVAKIDESDFRKRAQAWVDCCLAIGAIEKKKIDLALELARGGELSHIQRLWVFTQAAKLLAKTDHDKALSLLDDAASEVHRIDGGDLDRPRGLLAIANALTLIEPSRAWDAIFDAVKATNSSEGFTGEDGVITLNVNSKSQVLKKSVAAPDFDIEGIFSKAASQDYDRAVQLARGFQAEAPRANATLAISMSVLNSKTVNTPKAAAEK